MKNFIIRYILIFLIFTTFSNALEEGSEKLNLQNPTKLNMIEGKKGTLSAIKKDEVVNTFPSSDKKFNDIPINIAINIAGTS